MPSIVLMYGSPIRRPLVELENKDANSLREQLIASPSTLESVRLAGRIHTALKSHGDEESVEVPINDGEEFEAVVGICEDPGAMARVPYLTALCEAVERAQAEP